MQQDKLKKTLKLAWSKGLSLFMAMAGAILLVFLLFRFDSILDQILRVCNILMPIIMGIVIAYLLNPVVEFYERHLDRSLGKFIEKKTKKKVSMRGLSKCDNSISSNCSSNNDGRSANIYQYKQSGLFIT